MNSNDHGTVTDTPPEHPSSSHDDTPAGSDTSIPGSSSIPSVLIHHSQTHGPQIMTRSGRTVKPPQRYGT